MLAAIHRLHRTFKSTRSLKLLYRSFVRTYLEYCNVIWAPHHCHLHLECLPEQDHMIFARPVDDLRCHPGPGVDATSCGYLLISELHYTSDTHLTPIRPLPGRKYPHPLSHRPPECGAIVLSCRERISPPPRKQPPAHSLIRTATFFNDLSSNILLGM
ncbi:hypothetical protein J6590_046559 [Homalodisca vitripennis]|nr:hypothetical protein J6590_046559 [Homalodisca vitripennis]